MIPSPSLQPAAPSTFLLPGVPRVGFFMGGERCPENTPFPSCLRACLDYLGQGPNLGYRLLASGDTTWRLDLTYTFLMAVTGSAFRLNWLPGWLEASPTFHLEDFSRAFAACGYEMQFLDLAGGQNAGQACQSKALASQSKALASQSKALASQSKALASKSEALASKSKAFARILYSLREQRCPVIALGVFGPSEPCLITGCDEDGGALIGWSFYQDFPEYNAGVEKEPTGEFRKRDWFASTRGLLFFGPQRPLPPVEATCLAALRSALRLMRPAQPSYTAAAYNGAAMLNSAVLSFPKLQSRYQYGFPNQNLRNISSFGDHLQPVTCTGADAYQSWAEHLLRDSDFPVDETVLRQRFTLHDDSVSMVAEGRWYAARFMEWAAGILPHLEPDLLAAAACFDAEHELMWQIWGLVGGSCRSAENLRRLADPAVRSAIVPLIRQAAEKDLQAAGHIQHALEK